MKKSFLALVLLAAPLAGCASVAPDPLLTAAVRPDAPTLASEIAPEFAIALLPVTAGRIKSVRQTAAPDKLRQEIVYGNPAGSFGENMVTVSVGRSDLGGAFYRAPSRGQLAAEMRAALPGIAMALQPAINENAQGVFGYATGKFATNGSCLYGWQLIDPDHARGTVALMSGIDRKYRTRVRVRICDANLPQDRIVSLMEGLRVKPVTAQTLAMLQFATGSGQAAIAAPAAEPEAAPVVRTLRHKAHRKVAENQNLDDVILPITRRTPPAGLQTAALANSVPGQAMGIQQAAAVPMPGAGAIDTAPTAAVAAMPTAPKPVAKATLVPLPAATATAD